MINLSRCKLVALFGLLAAIFVLGFFFTYTVQGNANAGTRLRHVYARLTSLGGYTFSSTVIQTTHPLPTLSNVGLSSQTSSLLVEGEVDQRTNQIDLAITEGGGHLLDGMRQIEIRLHEGKVWGRVHGQDWESLDASQAPEAASSNPSALLQAAHNVQSAQVEERLGQAFEILTFELDGKAWAEIMRQELQAEMMRRGELAPGEVLERLEYYEKMSGVGEVWLNADGLPQRLKIHAVYPPLPGENEYREVEIVTDYQNFEDRTRAGRIEQIGADFVSGLWTSNLLSPPVLLEPHSISANATISLLLILFLLFPIALLRYRRSPHLYRATMLFLIATFTVEPVLSASVTQAASIRRQDRISSIEINRAEDDRIHSAVEQIKAEFQSQFDVTQSLMEQRTSELDMAAISAPYAMDQSKHLEFGFRSVTLPMSSYIAATNDTVDTDGDGLSDAFERMIRTSVTNKDTDSDGIDDATELLLGLDPIDPDSDGDLLSDSFEIKGIEMGGRTWYLNPLSTDTNADAIADALECVQAIDILTSPGGKKTKVAPRGTGLCADTDGDGIPDFADEDNDNDGVKDWMDGQPDNRFGDMTAGVPNQTFVYGIDHYTPTHPLRVTLEVRPTNPQHLWYSMNVLDWPSGDYQGQIRRVHNTTLGSTGAAANGDMQLIPMIEITLPGDEAIHLPTLPGKAPIVGDNARLTEWLDMPVLERYQMAVFWTSDKRSIQIFLPAALVRDIHGNAPVSFVSTLLYWPNGAGLFRKNHSARLVWVVQMDVDNCIAPENSTYQDSCLPEGKDYQDGIHWQTTKGQMVHRYYDNFYVTAFTAEQDLSASAQIFYENPTQIANPTAYVPDQLFGLGTMMENFLRQGKTPTQALADFKARNPAMGSRLAAGNLIQDADSFGLMSKVVTQEAPRLLDTVFAPHRANLPYPTMLYVIWGVSKVTGLGDTTSGDSLRLKMSDGAVKSSTSIRLGSFAYNPNPASVGERQNPNWDPADPGRVWINYLQNQSVATYQRLPQDTRQQFSAEQFQQVTLGIFWNLARGINLVNNLAKPVADDLNEVRGLVAQLSDAFNKSGQDTIGALIDILQERFKEPNGGLNLAGKNVTNVANLKSALDTSVLAQGLASVTFAGASATLSLILVMKDQLGLGAGTVVALEAINASMNAVVAGLQFSMQITKVIQNVKAAQGTVMQGLKQALALKDNLTKVGKFAAVVVVAIIVVTTLIIFFTLLSNGDTAGARTAMAQGVATVIIVLLLLFISKFFPIGTAIVLIIALVDSIITAICKIANWVGGEDDKGQNFEARNRDLCAGIVGNVTAFIAGIFYGSAPMVDMAYQNRLQFGQTDTQLIPVGNRVGMNAGNLMQVTQPVTITVRIPDSHSINQAAIITDCVSVNGIMQCSTVIKNMPGYLGVNMGAGYGSPLHLNDYDRLIKERNIFNYELITDPSAAKNSNLENRTTASNWKNVTSEDERDRLYKVDSPTTQITLSAGINWNPTLFVREYFKYSVAECGLFAGGCGFKPEHFSIFTSDTQVITIGTNLIYDVFPNNLTAFYTLEQVQENGQFVNKYRLAWGGKTPFPVLRDADGDGLAADIDPDDKIADVDGDGLPDTVEIQDFRLNPLRADSDSDGLSDYDEIRRGTRPDRADTDGDGLTDNEEITGWELVYVDAAVAGPTAGTTQRTWVRSDPLVADTSGDGLTDLQARVLGLNPRARYTDLSVLRISTSTDQTTSTFLAPNQSIAFTSTVSNDLRKPVAYGLLEAEILNSNQMFNPITFELQPQQSQAIRGNIQAPVTPMNNSEEIILRNRAGANIVDPSTSYADQLRGLPQPSGLKFWLNFEQRAANERSFQDVTRNAALTCQDGYCPSVMRDTNSYGKFQANGWYAVTGQNLAFSQPRFSLGGWVTLERAFGGTYNERVILGPDNVDGTDRRYLQLSVTDLQSSTPKARIHFTATDGAVCQQVLTDLTLPFGQKTHLFVTYDGTLVHGYRNGQLVGSYNLQNCAGKVPAGNRFTIGRGTTDATLFVKRIYFEDVDEGGSWLSSYAEPYMQLDTTVTPFWRKTGVERKTAHTVNVELKLRTATRGDVNSTVYICEEDYGNKQGQCRSDSWSDSDDLQGMVDIDPRRNGEFKKDYYYEIVLCDLCPPISLYEGNLSFNVQNNFFQGDLDDLRIYESTLSQQEVSQLVGGGGLHYQLDEAAGRMQFRTAGTDSTQLTCTGGAECPTSGVKGYTGQAVNFTGNLGQFLSIGRLRERFGSNLVASFWFKPKAGNETTPSPILRYGQEQQGFTLYATQQANSTNLRTVFNFSGHTTSIGGGGGNPYTLNCNPGEALVGISGGAANVVDRVGPLCVTTTPDYASWTSQPVQRGSAGGRGGSVYTVTCPSGSYVTGFSGRAARYVDRIELECARISSPGVLDSRRPFRLQAVGGNGGSTQPQQVCPSNLPANGIYGKSANLVDQFGLTCTGQPTVAGVNLAVDQWSHVGMAQSDDSLLLSINGQTAQTIWFGTSPRAEYRLTGNYSPDFAIGGISRGVRGVIDELQIQGYSTSSIQNPYTESALIHLSFDETTGSTTFANGTGRGDLRCTDAGRCPQAGLKGQVRESIQFNNNASNPLNGAPHLTLPADLSQQSFSFATWVRIPSVPAGTSSVVALHTAESSENAAWRLQLVNSNGRTVPQLTGQAISGNSCSGSFTVTPADVNLAVNQWHHLGVSYDLGNGRNDVTLYLNGMRVHQERLNNQICRTGRTMRFGQSYRGQLDEFFFYPRSLQVNEFLSHYVYQSTWYDVVTNDRFRVDYNAPTIRLTATPLVKPGTNIFGVAVSDAESGIRSVEYRDTDGQWKAARTETATGGVWTFGMNVQGNVELAVRATDNVGNVSTDSRTIGVDNSAPIVNMTTTGKQPSLIAAGSVSDTGSGVQSLSMMFIDPYGNPLNSPRDVSVVNGGWQFVAELPPTANGSFQVWAAAVDQIGNQFQGVIGNVLVDNAPPMITLNTMPTALTGLNTPIDPNLPTIQGMVNDLPTGNVAPNASPSVVQRVEVGLLHRQDKDDASKLVWREATLGSSGQVSTTWQFQIPAGMEGIYDISLRATDAMGNQRIMPGMWTGVIDTRAPQIVLAGGATLGMQSCTVIDFSLRQDGFICGNATGVSSAASALYASGIFTEAALTWSTQWYRDLFLDGTPADRLYAIHQTGVSFADPNRRAASCDIYGNCTACVLTSNDVSLAGCSAYRESGAARSAINDAPAADQALFNTELTGPGSFTVTVHYERPDAYAPWDAPAQPTSEWVEIVESYMLVQDAILASTRPFSVTFTEASTEIKWTESISATGYYVGWTENSIPNRDDLTFYAVPDVHTQMLPDQGRYYAHVMAVDDENGVNAFTLGPIYFDGAPPSSYLNWDEFGPAQPYWFWERSLLATGQFCNLLGEDDRVNIFTSGASARSHQQALYGTWNDEWLALHWSGLNPDGDLHLYLDTAAGGSLYAFNPYHNITQATSLVLMPERRQYQTDAVDRMLANFAVLVEDSQNVRLLQWNGTAWTDLPTAQMRFTLLDGVAYIWLPLNLLGIDPNAVDVSIVGFLTEEESMEIWATMPGNNPLNSPTMLPSHQPPAVAVDRALVNLQTSIRLSAHPAVNTNLDNCPTNVLLEQSLLDVQFIADPAAEVYDPVVYEGLQGVVPQDVQDLLAALCVGVNDPGEGTVCDLAQKISDGFGGDGPEKGPTGQYLASAGPGDSLTFYATIRNLSSQATGYLTLEVEEANDLLPISGAVLDVGVLDAFESRVITFTEVVDPSATYDFTWVSVYPVENVENVYYESTFSYVHKPHTVIHDIDRAPPTDAKLADRLLVNLLGTGEQLLEGIVYDQSLVTEVTLQTSLGQSFTCDETQRQTAFTTSWACAITLPENTPDGTMITVSLSAEDRYGFASGVIAEWEFEVDNSSPEITLFENIGLATAGMGATANITETFLIDGLVEDNHWLSGLQICDTLQGYESCQEAELIFFSDYLNDENVRSAFSSDSADRAYWMVERPMDLGIEGVTTPITVTAYDAAGNTTRLNFSMLIDTLAPTVTLTTLPLTQIGFSDNFSISGRAVDRAGVGLMDLEVVDPLGEVSLYSIALDNPSGTDTNWTYEFRPDSEAFAMPGTYSYTILAEDVFYNERRVGPYTLTVDAPPQPLLNDPFFVSISNDLWDGLVPGEPVYMRVEFDDPDLAFGDAITVTVDPIPAWLSLTWLDERTVEITGTVPITITEITPPQELVAELEGAEASSPTLLQLNVGMVLTDSTGRQAYQEWIYERVLDVPSTLYLPNISAFSEGGQVPDDSNWLYLPIVSR